MKIPKYTLLHIVIAGIVSFAIAATLSITIFRTIPASKSSIIAPPDDQSICDSTHPEKENGPLFDETYNELDRILKDKKEQLETYIAKLNNNAESVSRDEIMLQAFSILDDYHNLSKNSLPPENVQTSMAQLELNLRDHYMRNYLSFYDLLFIDRNGDIFFTIRHEADYMENVFAGEFAKTELAKQMKNNNKNTFVDYQYYEFSDEPSAFIIIPVPGEGSPDGWIVFQCAINKINNMFTQEKNLGRTGEVFLVNRNRYMLTDSRFYGESSILKRDLSPENIEAKFSERVGHKTVVDYRGFRALSSFEVFRIGNSEWLIIAKIDEDEIVTDRYRQRKDELRKKLLSAISDASPDNCMSEIDTDNVMMVDMDEYRKASAGEIIGTHGVSTCTALIVTMPGRFSYLAHLSNLDVSYGGLTTDLLGHILKQIKTFDLYRYETRHLDITVVANHTDSIMNMVDNLVDNGIFLSQIRFAYNPNAISAATFSDCSAPETVINWTINRETGESARQCSSGIRSFGDIALKNEAFL